MPNLTRAAIAVAASMVIALFPFGVSASDAVPRPLVETLESWLDRNTVFARVRSAPSIELAYPEDLIPPTDLATAIGRTPRGLYDPITGAITLVRPWNTSNVHDQSVLIHELFHHRQARRHYFCRAAQEFAAYNVQQAWLTDRGQALDVNWIAIVLASSCARRDVHPDE